MKGLTGFAVIVVAVVVGLFVYGYFKK